MAAHIAAAPAIGSHVGVTCGGGEADLQAPHASGLEEIEAFQDQELRERRVMQHPATMGDDEHMKACQFVAIALLRVAMTAYENAVGPLVKEWAKSTCAVLH